VTLRVLRPASTSFTAVANSETQTVTSDMNTFVTSLPIKAGDVLGLDNDSSGLYFTNAPSIALPLVKYFQPALGAGATGAPNNQQTNLELLMNADVTPNVAGVPPGGTTPTPKPKPTPAISNLRLKPSTFRAAKSGGTVARKRPPIGTRVSYALSTAATVAIKVERKTTGRRRGGKCKKAGARARGKRCTLYRAMPGSFNVGGRRGENSFNFTGRLSGEKLGRGKYRLIATPSTGFRAGTAAQAAFKVR
jgi:hypothetical protein